MLPFNIKRSIFWFLADGYNTASQLCTYYPMVESLSRRNLTGSDPHWHFAITLSSSDFVARHFEESSRNI
jgi:hypothetical protein